MTRRPQQRRTARGHEHGAIDLPERVVCGLLGVFFGGVIGALLAWMFGVWSHTMGPGRVGIPAAWWIGGCALVLGAAGAIFGAAAGALVAQVFAGLFAFERMDRADDLPWRWVLLVLAAVIVFAVWSVR